MRNNRQVGLDGKVFLTSCLKRSSIYVLGVIFFGVISAIADVMKLIGKSGTEMSSLTTTLVSLDLIVSLLFVVIVFYAYFLECGSSIPVLREKPIIILGYCRLAYNVLLCYYIVYRAMYCIVNSSEIPFGILAFYVVYMVVAFMSILACCFIINVISRNMIRRIYIRSLRNLAVVGIVFTALMPIMYIVARFWIGEIGDEYFTNSFCDLLRLCVAPILYICVWIVLLKARTVTTEVFGEVDAAIRDRRYQITYTDNTKNTEEKTESKKLKNSKAKAAAAAATVAAIEASTVQPALPESKKQQNATEKKDEENKVTAEAEVKTEEAKAEPKEAIYPQRVVTENTIKTRESKIKDEKLRKAVSEAVEKAIKEEEAAAKKTAQEQVRARTQSQTQNKQASHVKPQQKMPVMDFDPYAQAEKAQNRARQVPQNGRNVQQQRNGQRPVQQRPQQARPQNPQQNRNNQQRPQQGRSPQNSNQRKK